MDGESSNEVDHGSVICGAVSPVDRFYLYDLCYLEVCCVLVGYDPCVPVEDFRFSHGLPVELHPNRPHLPNCVLDGENWNEGAVPLRLALDDPVYAHGLEFPSSCDVPRCPLGRLGHHYPLLSHDRHGELSYDHGIRGLRGRLPHRSQE